MDKDISDATKTMLPYKWWDNYGADYPTLKPLAVRLLSQVLGARLGWGEIAAALCSTERKSRQARSYLLLEEAYQAE